MSAVYTFDPVIYPRLLWIAVGGDQHKDRFDGLSEMSEHADALCDLAYDREDKRGGVFLRFKGIEQLSDVGIVTHESIHAAMAIYEYIDCKVDIDNQEHLCYLAGWAAKCCDEAKKGELDKKTEK